MLPIKKYISPFTDFGFKKIFGETENKDLLINFLNTLLQLDSNIIDLTYLKNEHFPDFEEERKAIFDLFCENEKGEKFIVELQRAPQKNFKDRTLYYASFVIREQAQTGRWDFELKTVYVVSILDFVLEKNQQALIHRVGLLNLVSHEVFNPHLQFVYVEMPKFTKKEKDLKTLQDKWLFILKNLEQLGEIPEKTQEEIFQKLFKVAEYLKLSPADKEAYQESYKVRNDLQNVLETAYEKGLEKGLEEVILRAIAQGLSDKKIAKLTALPTRQIASFRTTKTKKRRK